LIVKAKCKKLYHNYVRRLRPIKTKTVDIPGKTKLARGH